MEFLERPLSGNYRFIIGADPALDRKAEGFADRYRIYQETGSEEGLPLLQGQKPVRFVLRHLYGRAEAKIKELVRQTIETPRGLGGISVELCYLAAQMALEDVEGLPSKEGGEFPLQFVTDEKTGIRHVSEYVMGQLQGLKDGDGHRNVVEYVGREVIRRTFFAPLS